MRAFSPETVPLSTAALRLGIGQKAARRAAARGDLPAFRINGRWRVPSEALQGLLKSSNREGRMD